MGFYRGLGPTIVSTIPHAGVALSTYQMSKEFFTRLANAEQPTAAALVGAATVSTVCGLTVSAPMHVIKTRLIMGNGSIGTLRLIRDTWQHEGPGETVMLSAHWLALTRTHDSGFFPWLCAVARQGHPGSHWCVTHWQDLSRGGLTQLCTVSFGAYEFFRRAFGLQEKHHKKH